MIVADEGVATDVPALLRLRGFVEWVGSGQPLTQTGRIRRADALALVERLDSGDVLDPRYPIKSSSELPGLELLVEWAKRCRLVRVVRGRIVAVRGQARLLDELFGELIGRGTMSVERGCELAWNTAMLRYCF